MKALLSFLAEMFCLSTYQEPNCDAWNVLFVLLKHFFANPLISAVSVIHTHFHLSLSLTLALSLSHVHTQHDVTVSFIFCTSLDAKKEMLGVI